MRRICYVTKKKERTGKSQIKWELCYSEKYSWWWIFVSPMGHDFVFFICRNCIVDDPYWTCLFLPLNSMVILLSLSLFFLFLSCLFQHWINRRVRLFFYTSSDRDRTLFFFFSTTYTSIISTLVLSFAFFFHNDSHKIERQLRSSCMPYDRLAHYIYALRTRVYVSLWVKKKRTPKNNRKIK